MNVATTANDIERFRVAIRHRLGLQFDDAKLDFLNEVLRRRTERRGRGCHEYLSALEDGGELAELGALAQDLTVTETYFFRNIEQFRALQEVVLPERMRARAAARSLRLLSAACASGEEAYTLAMVAREAVPDPSWSVSIRAVDINPGALAKARKGRYAAWALRETPADLQRRWFRAEERHMVLDETIRGAVTFEARNLAAAEDALWAPDSYDAVYCRNALMYFAPEQATRLVARIAQALTPGGYLFLGHAETLRGLSDDFHLRHSHGTFYYQRKDGPPSRRREPERVAAAAVAPAADFPYVGREADVRDDAWVESIHQASRRIEALIAAPPRGSDPAPPLTSGWDLAGTLDLLRSERFDEALARVRNLPPEAEDDPEILLLEAMLLAHAGEFDGSAAVCQRLLARDGMNAGARYVLALCREGLGDPGGAVEQDRAAIYLDATFAMPRLHLGLLARRAEERELGRRELGQALALLKQEDASRLLLFGGGFSRQALIALCSAALRDCGGEA